MTDEANRQNNLALIESEKIINARFTDVKRIDTNGGNGYFSLLFRAHDLRTGKDVALKFFDPTKNFDTERLSRFQREAEMLKVLESEPYVLDCVDGLSILNKTIVDAQTGVKFLFQFQYIPLALADCSVEDFVYSQNPEPLTILTCFKEMFKGVIRVHNRGICHRDLKPNNFLIMRGRQVCLSDFGTAKCMNGTTPDISKAYEYHVGDLHYASPELMCAVGIADPYVFHTDMFSMGAILFEMFTRHRLTPEIYTPETLTLFVQIRHAISSMPVDKRIEAYRALADDLSKRILLPDLDLYDPTIPKSIKNQLNALYKGLSAVSLWKRLKNPNEVHRKLDICIKVLRNEESYLKWLSSRRTQKANKGA